MECTAFQLAGALNEEAIREAVDFVTNALLRDGDSPHSPSSPAYPSASAEAAVAQVSHAFGYTLFQPPLAGQRPSESASGIQVKQFRLAPHHMADSGHQRQHLARQTVAFKL